MENIYIFHASKKIGKLGEKIQIPKRFFLNGISKYMLIILQECPFIN